MNDVQRIRAEVHKPREWKESELKIQFQQFKDNNVPESTTTAQMYAESAFANKDLALKVIKQIYGTYTGEEEKIEAAQTSWFGSDFGTGLTGAGAAPSPGVVTRPSVSIGPIDPKSFSMDNVYFPSAYTQLGD